MSGIEAICFDLDGTLCLRDDRRFHEAIFEIADIEPFFGPTAVNEVDIASLPTADSVTEFWEHIFHAIATDVGGNPDHAPELATATTTVLQNRPPVTFTDGATEALTYARDRFDVGVITQGSAEMQTAKIEALGLADFFDVTVFCGPATAVRGKPDPDPFERALDELGRSPEQAVYVGDSLKKDVAGARNVGMDSVWVPPAEVSPDPKPEPTYRLDSLGELPGCFE